MAIDPIFYFSRRFAKPIVRESCEVMRADAAESTLRGSSAYRPRYSAVADKTVHASQCAFSYVGAPDPVRSAGCF